MLKKVLAVATVIGSLIATSTTSAAILSYQFDHALETTEFAQTGNLGLFDPSLGVLNSVTLTLTGQMSTMLTLTNNAA